jgi:hypothetical protein
VFPCPPIAIRQHNVEIASEPVASDIYVDQNTGITFVWIPPGEFEMGSNNITNEEKPIHKIKISRGLWLGKYPVTNADYKRFSQSNNGGRVFSGAGGPSLIAPDRMTLPKMLREQGYSTACVGISFMNAFSRAYRTSFAIIKLRFCRAVERVAECTRCGDLSQSMLWLKLESSTTCFVDCVGLR